MIPQWYVRNKCLDNGRVPSRQRERFLMPAGAPSVAGTVSALSTVWRSLPGGKLRVPQVFRFLRNLANFPLELTLIIRAARPANDTQTTKVSSSLNPFSAALPPVTNKAANVPDLSSEVRIH